MKKQVIKEISDRDHVLLRPGRYIGQINEVEEKRLLFNGTSLSFKEIKYVPGLLKIIREVIDNSIDEHIRSQRKFANKIDVSIVNDEFIVVKDNGRGIPNEISENGKHYAELAWCRLKAGSNFDDTDENKIGQNGEGVCLTNIFSKIFIGETCDGETRVKIEAKNNLENYVLEKRKCKKQGTIVKFLPDYKRFNIKEEKLPKIYKDIIFTELLILSIIHPTITFSFNNKKLFSKKLNFKQFLSYYLTPFEYIKTDGLKIGILPSNNQYLFYHNINGVYVKNGGESLNWVVNNICSRLVEKFKRKYKNIKSSDVKNNLCFIVFFTKMPSPRFGDQVKETCINKYSKFKDSIGEVNFDKLVYKIYRNKELIKNIIDYFQVKEKVKEKQLLRAKNKKKIKSTKYLAPIKEYKYFLLCEGASALGGISRVIGRKNCGYYEMRGKILNVLTAKVQKIISNKEVVEIRDILNLDFTTKKVDKVPFEKIVFATDFDFDGISIQSLLLSYFYKFAPDLIKQKRICILKTPLVILFNKKKIYKMFFTIEEFIQFSSKKDISKYEIKYYKGLGSFKDSVLEKVFESKGGFENFIEELTYDKDEELKMIELWMSNEHVSFRKEKIKERDFSIDLI